MTNDADQDPTAAALALERAQAVALFNHAWSLLDMPERSASQDLDLIHCAHASRWHWGRAGGPQEWAVGEWQCSRAYATIGRAEPSLVHAQRCLALCSEHHLDGYIVASAHEALARAYLLDGDPRAARTERDRAAELAAGLPDPADRAVVEGDLATLPPL
ncbi:MAG: hypothetical protein OEU98_05160 [Actinomycetota bacterium]|nr:hypothetical protein [Actinomycetota bacterium]